jgi:hypothetical protein
VPLCYRARRAEQQDSGVAQPRTRRPLVHRVGPTIFPGENHSNPAPSGSVGTVLLSLHSPAPQGQSRKPHLPLVLESGSRLRRSRRPRRGSRRPRHAVRRPNDEPGDGLATGGALPTTALADYSPTVLTSRDVQQHPCVGRGLTLLAGLSRSRNSSSRTVHGDARVVASPYVSRT